MRHENIGRSHDIDRVHVPGSRVLVSRANNVEFAIFQLPTGAGHRVIPFGGGSL
jgi:hypothetical protein